VYHAVFPNREATTPGEETHDLRLFAIDEEMFKNVLERLDAAAAVAAPPGPLLEETQEETMEGISASQRPAPARDENDDLLGDLAPAAPAGGAPEVGHGLAEMETELVFATEWYTFQRGVGEMRQLPVPKPGNVWAKGATTEGSGAVKSFVAQYNPTTQEYSDHIMDVFKQRLLRSPDPPASEADLPDVKKGLLIQDAESNATAWRSEAERLS
jgi:hypothetical protein